MPKAHNPRHGSMQVWPRVRAKRIYPSVNRFSTAKEAKLMGFAGYKAGMTHIIITDGRKNSMTKGEDISIPVTVVECPPVRIAGARLYKKKYKTLQAAGDFLAKADKEMARKITVPKKASNKIDAVKPEDYDDLRVLVQTQPKMTGTGKKKPEFFEMCVGGSKEDKLNFVKENLGKELSVKDVFAEGQAVDIHAVTKGKGFQGPVKRFGIKVRTRKSEKTKRGPGSLGDWKHKMTWRVAHAGQMGFHNRIDYNKQIMMIGDDVGKVNIAGGFVRYGQLKNTYLLIKGSIPGPSKRIIRLETAMRPNKKIEQAPQTVQYISTRSNQGR
ncbi:50S ribosomal protein L3 [Candidatus Woesearchaeota archaeon]|nr:50S ribosomal protein L3 [Candidatus Woesearchaeota archaeon]